MVLSKTDELELARSPRSYIEGPPQVLHIGACSLPDSDPFNVQRWKQTSDRADKNYMVQAFVTASFKTIRNVLKSDNSNEEGLGETDQSLSLKQIALDTSHTPKQLCYALECILNVCTVLASASTNPQLKYQRRKFDYGHVAAYGVVSGPLCRWVLESCRNEAELMARGIEAVKMATILGLNMNKMSPKDKVPLLVKTTATGTDECNWISELEKTGRRIGTTVEGSPVFSVDKESAKDFQKRLHAASNGYALVLPSWNLVVPDIVEPLATQSAQLHARDSTFMGEDAAQPFFLEILRGSLNDFESHQHAIAALMSATVGTSSSVSEGLKIEFLGCSETFVKDHVRICGESGLYVQAKNLDMSRLLSSDPSRRPTQASAVVGTPAGEIAIVGMGCHVPGAEGTEAFWKLLQDGLDVHQPIPCRLFNLADYQSASYRDKNTMRAQHMNALDRPDIFDANFFDIDEEFAVKMDPQQRLALKVVHDTLGTASYHPNASPSFDPAHVGVFVGVCSDDYRENVSIDIQKGFCDGTFRAQIANRISSFYGWRGPSVTLDTACSGALVSIESACSYLAAGKCNAAVAGGINILTQPQIFIGLDRGFFLNSTGQCKTFDDGGDGYSRADAVSFVMLKRMQDAVAEGDRILGSICSIATNHSGESHSITHPHAPTQRRLYEANMLAAGITPADVNYLECHGTGTQAGDGQEMAGILSVFGKDSTRSDQLIVGSAKANVGHSESGSGATSLVKTLMCLQNRYVPRHVGIKGVMNKGFGDLSRICIPIDGAEMKSADGESRYAMVSNFSAAGGNTNLVIREGRHSASVPTKGLGYSNAESPDLDQRPHLFALSAKSHTALQRLVSGYLDRIKGDSLSLAELCYSSTGRQLHHNMRVCGVVTSVADVQKLLESQKVDETFPKAVPSGLCFVFSGQGSQYVNMGSELFNTVPDFRRSMEKCNRLVMSFGYPDFLSAIYPDGEQADPTPYQNQVGIFALEYSLSKLWLDWGIVPSAVAGHSLGEYTSLCVAGVLSLEDALYLVATRAMIMVEHCKANVSGMLAIRVSPEEVEEVLDTANVAGCEIACRNGPSDTVIAGPLDAIDLASKAFEEKKIKVFKVSVPYAFHSAAIEPLLEPYKEAASKVKFQAPLIPVLSNVHGRVVRANEDWVFNQAYLLAHARGVVRFGESVAALLSDAELSTKFDWVEVGPHPICLPMIKGVLTTAGQPTDPGATIASMRKGSDSLVGLLSAVAFLYLKGHNICWPNLHKASGSTARTIELPAYPFDEKSYWQAFQDRGLRDHLVKPCPDLITKKSVRKLAAGRGKVKKSKKRALGVKKEAAGLRSHSRFTILAEASVSGSLDDGTLSFIIDAHREPSEALIMGHLIRGKGMMSASLISELALEVGYYVDALNPNDQSSERTFRLKDINMYSPFLKNYGEKVQMRLQVRGKLDSTEGLSVEFFTVQDTSRPASHNASCYVHIDDGETERDWAQLGPLITGRNKKIMQNAESCFSTRMAYQLFETVVEYTDIYRGMKKVYVTSSGEEAVAMVKRTVRPSGKFVVDPSLQDGVGQM